MNIQLTKLQYDRLIELVEKEYKLTGKLFYMGLAENLRDQSDNLNNDNYKEKLLKLMYPEGIIKM